MKTLHANLQVLAVFKQVTGQLLGTYTSRVLAHQHILQSSAFSSIFDFRLVAQCDQQQQ